MGDVALNPGRGDVEINNDSRKVILPMVKSIMHWLTIEEIEEIAINRPGEIWLRLRKPDENGDIWVRRLDPEMTKDYLVNTIYALANISNTPDFGPDGSPVTYGTLPGGHRYAAALGPNFQFESGELDPDGTVLFCSRQSRPDISPQFKDLGLERGKDLSNLTAAMQRKSDSSDPLERLLSSINRGDHIMVSGATGSGKTTLLNKIIAMLPQNLRIVTVEDTSEIKVNQPNHMHVLMNRSNQSNKFDYKSVVDLVVRMTPDVVMAGEISTTNAATIWELMRSGHGSFMTTIHAESTAEALSTFVTRIGHSSPAAATDRERLISEMQSKIRIIQIERDHNGRRKITAVA